LFLCFIKLKNLTLSNPPRLSEKMESPSGYTIFDALKCAKTKPGRVKAAKQSQIQPVSAPSYKTAQKIADEIVVSKNELAKLNEELVEKRCVLDNQKVEISELKKMRTGTQSELDEINVMHMRYVIRVGQLQWESHVLTLERSALNRAVANLKQELEEKKIEKSERRLCKCPTCRAPISVAVNPLYGTVFGASGVVPEGHKEDDNMRATCIVCEYRFADVVFECRHMVCCHACAIQL
jgi:hypothetical protein